MKTKKSLFFSYGNDRYVELVLKIKTQLEQHGFCVFLDHEKLHVGSDWESTLEQAISEYEDFLFFITKHSARRPDGYCLNEVALAILLNKNIIPILLENQKPPLSIIRLQYIDFQDLQKVVDTSIFNQKIEYLISILNGEKSLDSEGIQASLLRQLDPIDFTQDFKKHQIIGREWLIEKINQLLERNEDSRVLWVTADAGYGKSAIAAYLAEFHPDVIGIHFCSYSSPEKKDPINVIKTLAFHFQSQIDGYYDEIKFIDINGKSADRLMDDLILNPLERLTDIKDRYLFIIDGIDEALDGEKNPLIDLVQEKFNLLPQQIKIIITSRKEPYIQQSLSRYRPIVLHADEEENIHDCKLLIEKKLKENNYKIENEEYFIQKLLDQSEANMLYLINFFESVNEGYVELNNVDAFPEGLNSFYIAYFQRKFPLLEKYDKEIALIFEQIIVFSGEVNAALIVKILHLTKAQVDKKIYLIGAFVHKKDELEYFDFYHKSFKDWLLRDDNRYQVDMERAYENLYDFFTQMDEEELLANKNNIYFHYLFISFCFEKNHEKHFKSFLKVFDIEVLFKVVNLFIEEKKYIWGYKLQKYIENNLNTYYENSQSIKYFIQLLYLKVELREHLQEKIEFEALIDVLDKTISSEQQIHKHVQEYVNLLILLYESSPSNYIWNKMQLLLNSRKNLIHEDSKNAQFWKKYKNKINEIEFDRKKAAIPKIKTFILFAIAGIFFAGIIGGYIGNKVEQQITIKQISIDRKKVSAKDIVTFESNSSIVTRATAGAVVATTGVANIIKGYMDGVVSEKNIYGADPKEIAIINSIITGIPIVGIIVIPCLLSGVDIKTSFICFGAIIFTVIALFIIVLFAIILIRKKRKRILQNFLNNQRKLKLVSKSFESAPQEWVNSYIKIIEELFKIYSKSRKPDRIQKIIDRHWYIFENLYRSNPNRWGNVYVKVKNIKIYSTLK